MPNVCCDTSFLFALYADDMHTPVALRALSRVRQSLALSSFNRFELANAFRLAEFRGLLPLGPAVDYLDHLERDIAGGSLRMVRCNLEAVLTESERLSALYTHRDGFRAFDILHVAAALHLGASEFLSFDTRQRTLAGLEGLIVGP